MRPYKNRPLEQGLSGGKQKRGCENRKIRAPKVQSPGWGTGEFKKMDPPPHIAVQCGDFSSVPVCPKANTTRYYPYPYFSSSLLVFTAGHAGPRILRGPTKNPCTAPPRGAGNHFFFTLPRHSPSGAPHFQGPLSQFPRAPFQLSPANSLFRVPGFCGAPPGALLLQSNFAPRM